MDIVRLNLMELFVFVGMLCAAAKPPETVIIHLPVSNAARTSFRRNAQIPEYPSEQYYRIYERSDVY